MVMLLRDFVLALISTLSFAMLFNVPRRTVVWCALIGGTGYVAKELAVHAGGTVEVASLAGSLLVGLLGELAARQLRAPAAVFIKTGFVPLVPGALSYRTVLFFITGDYTQGTVYTVKTALIGIAIAGGIGVVTSLFRLVERRKDRSGYPTKV